MDKTFDPEEQDNTPTPAEYDEFCISLYLGDSPEG